MELATKDLREKRKRLANEAREVLDTAAKDGREALRSDEEEKWKALHAEIDRLASHIELREKQDEEERRQEETTGRKADPNPATTETRAGGDPTSAAAIRRLRMGQRDTMEGLRAWLLHGTDRMTDAHVEAAKRIGLNPSSKSVNLLLPRIALRDLHGVTDWENRAQAEEARAQSVGTNTAGGYTVPDEMMRPLEVALLQFGGMRQVSNVIRTDTGADLPFPTSNDTTNKGVILGENTQVTGQDITFGQLVLQAYKYSSKLVLVSVELLQDNAVNIAEFIGKALGERIGRITNDHFTTGTGASQPNGAVTAATLGVTAASATAITYGELVDLEHSVDPAYRTNGTWMFADSTLKLFKKLVDGDSRPLWMPAMASGMGARVQQDTLLGYPYVINQSMPAAATGLKSVLFGDFNKYLIRDVREITLLRLDERYADLHQVGFLAFSRHDGDLLDAGTHPLKYLIQA